jgi:hypothetical protein
MPSFAVNYEVFVFLDGEALDLDAVPEVKNGRTLIPIRPVAESIGADVVWDGETQTVTITRAGKEILLVIGRDTATVNGESVTMDAAPYVSNGRTLLPLRFVAEQFSQTVEYNDLNISVHISEDMTFAEDTNIREWLLGCGAILAEVNNNDPYSIGMNKRNADGVVSARQSLSGSWGSNSREEVMGTILRMTTGGHNISFMRDAAIAASLSDEEMEELLAASSGVDKYMWPLVVSLSDKWGERGIIAWDAFRMTHLAGWGYVAGYLELEEAYALAEPSIMILRENFSSWDEATENYLDGFAYWGRIDLSENDNRFLERSEIYEKLKADQEEDGLLFDPSVWESPVRGLATDS